MYDWNHNGEYDAFDTATDMMLLDEMDKALSNNSKAYSHYTDSSAKSVNQNDEAMEELEDIKPWQMRLTGCVFFYFLLYPLFKIPTPIRDFLADIGYTAIVLWLGVAFALGNFVCDLIYREEMKNAKQEETL